MIWNFGLTTVALILLIRSDFIDSNEWHREIDCSKIQDYELINIIHNKDTGYDRTFFIFKSFAIGIPFFTFLYPEIWTNTENIFLRFPIEISYYEGQDKPALNDSRITGLIEFRRSQKTFHYLYRHPELKPQRFLLSEDSPSGVIKDKFNDEKKDYLELVNSQADLFTHFLPRNYFTIVDNKKYDVVWALAKGGVKDQSTLWEELIYTAANFSLLHWDSPNKWAHKGNKWLGSIKNSMSIRYSMSYVVKSAAYFDIDKIEDPEESHEYGYTDRFKQLMLIELDDQKVQFQMIHFKFLIYGKQTDENWILKRLNTVKMSPSELINCPDYYPTKREHKGIYHPNGTDESIYFIMVHNYYYVYHDDKKNGKSIVDRNFDDQDLRDLTLSQKFQRFRQQWDDKLFYNDFDRISFKYVKNMLEESFLTLDQYQSYWLSYDTNHQITIQRTEKLIHKCVKHTLQFFKHVVFCVDEKDYFLATQDSFQTYIGDRMGKRKIWRIFEGLEDKNLRFPREEKVQSIFYYEIYIVIMTDRYLFKIPMDLFYNTVDFDENNQIIGYTMHVMKEGTGMSKIKNCFFTDMHLINWCDL